MVQTITELQGAGKTLAANRDHATVDVATYLHVHTAFDINHRCLQHVACIIANVVTGPCCQTATPGTSERYSMSLYELNQLLFDIHHQPFCKGSGHV